MVKFVCFIVVKNGRVAAKYKGLETALRRRDGGEVWKVTEYYKDNRLQLKDSERLI